jgi:hypothetical protein
MFCIQIVSIQWCIKDMFRVQDASTTTLYRYPQVVEGSSSLIFMMKVMV